MSEPPSDRPKWSINWGLRIERIGRNRRERDADDLNQVKDKMRIRLGYVVIGLVLLLEVAIGVWLGVLPR